jgi:hypothetical protein
MNGTGAKHAAAAGRGSESGQSTVEFALTLILLLSFVLAFIQVSLVFAWGNFVHYATFMSARAYLSAGPTREDQQQRAKDVVIRMLKKGEGGTDRFPLVARGEGGLDDVAGMELDGGTFVPGERGSSWLQGVRYTFKSRVFLIPFAGKRGRRQVRGPAGGKDDSSLTLTSESWLLRDPTTEECVTEMNGKGKYDNGC